MVNNSNNNISPDVLGSAIAQIMSQLNQGRRNMSLDEKWVAEKKQVELDAIKRISDLSSGIVDVTKVIQKFNDKTSGIDVGDLGTKFEEMLRKHNDDISEELQNFVDTLEENRKKVKQRQKNEAFNTVTNGRSGRVDAFGERVADFGDSLKKLSGKKGVLGKAGNAIIGLGKFATKASGALAGLQIISESLYNNWKKGIEIANMVRDYSGKDIAAQYSIKTTKFNAAAQMKQQDMQVAQAIQSASQSAASAAQSAMGAFAQEAVGIHSEMATEGKKIGYDAYATSHEIASELPFDIKGGVYKAAEAAIDFASQAQNYGTKDKYAGKSIEIAGAKMANQIAGARAAAGAQIAGAMASSAIQKGAIQETTGRTLEIQNKQLANQRADAAYQVGRAEDIKAGGVLAGSAVKWWKETFSDVSESANKSQRDFEASKLESRNNTLNNMTTQIANIESQNAQNIAQAKAFNAQQIASAREIGLNIKKQQQDMNKNIEIAANEAAAKIQKAWLKMTEKLNDTFLKHQQASTVMGREMGMTGDKLAKYSDRMFAYQVEVSKWGKDLEWMQKAQGGYQESTGRNVEWSQNDYETSAGMGMLVGDDTISQYVSGMEIFNQSVEDSNEKLYTMFKDVSKIGLNGKKYAKELAGSLKLAEKYNFKEGTKSLREMVKWAQNMRFNMGSLDGMLDKVQEGGLEGVIKQSAELQVLGGNFAMGSDPLAMAYESYMDPEAYAKRMNSMIAGQGMFDSKTGEVSFGIASQQMMRQYANSTGQDYKDVLNQARAQVKMGQINGELNGNFTEDQKMMIANKAQYDTETGKWKVQVGKSKVDVDKLSDKDIEALTPSEDVEQDMLTELQSLRSLQETYNADQMKNMATLENTMLPNLIDTNKSILGAIGEEFKSNFETYVTESMNGLEQLRNAPQKFLDIMAAGNDDVDSKRLELMGKIDDLIGTLQGVDKSAEGHKASAMAQGAPAPQLISAQTVDTSDLRAQKADAETIPESGVKEKKSFNWGRIADYAGAGALIGGAAAGLETGGISAGGGALTGALVGAVQSCFEYFVPETWQNSMSEAWGSFTDFASSTWGGISKVASSAWGGISKVASSAWNTISDSFIGRFVGGVYKFVTGAAKIAWDGIKILGEWVWKNVEEIASKAWNNIKEVGLAIWSPIRDTASSIWNSVKDTASGVWNNIKEVGLAIWSPIKDTASGIWNSVKDTASGIWNSVKDTASGIWGEIKKIAMKIWEPLEKVGKDAWEGITDAFDGVANAASSLWNGLKGFVHWIGNFVSAVSLGEFTTFVEYVKNGFKPTAEMKREHPGMFHDGYIRQNGETVKIDDNDQVLAAKQGGPVDKMLNIIGNASQVTPLPKRYDSFVRESLYSDKGSDGKIEIAPIQININGNIQLTGSNGTIDITQQISNDPNFIRALTQMISIEVEKKARGGRTNGLLNRNLEF